MKISGMEEEAKGLYCKKAPLGNLMISAASTAATKQGRHRERRCSEEGSQVKGPCLRGISGREKNIERESSGQERAGKNAHRKKGT